MKDQFELAYYRYLNDRDFKVAIIECGLSAVISGFETESVVLLSAAEAETDHDIVDMFLLACLEVGIDLPVKSKSEEWVAEISVRYLIAGIAPFKLNRDTQFYKNILVGYSGLKEADSAKRFVELLGELVKSNSHINNYQVWLECLEVERTNLQKLNDLPTVEKEVINDITDLIISYSYGAIEEHHYQKSFEIAVRSLNDSFKQIE